MTSDSLYIIYIILFLRLFLCYYYGGFFISRNQEKKNLMGSAQHFPVLSPHITEVNQRIKTIYTLTILPASSLVVSTDHWLCICSCTYPAYSVTIVTIVVRNYLLQSDSVILVAEHNIIFSSPNSGMRKFLPPYEVTNM